MKGDFTRDTFDPAKHFSRVLMQQGRVTLDADFNEQAAILLRYLRTLARDIIGPYAAPAQGGGFNLLKLDPDPNKGVFSISKGCYYVDGIFVENDADGCTYATQPDYEPSSDDPLLKAPEGDVERFFIYLDVWERHITPIEDDSIRETALGGPNTCTRAKVVWQVRAAPVTAELWDEAQQAEEQNAKLLLDLYGQKNKDLQEYIAAKTDKDRLPLLTEIQMLDESIERLTRLRGASLHQTLLNQLVRQSIPELAARVDPGRKTEDACVTPPASKYRGAENQLYRVEIHNGGNVGDNPPATFKWSHDNGSVATAWLGGEGSDLQVVSTRGFAAGSWVELSDDNSELLGIPGTLVQLVKVEGTTVSVDPATTLPPISDFPKNSKIRRWDQIATEAIPLANDNAVPIQESPADATPEQIVWIDLEDGVQIQFSAGGNYRTGDYWLIPARVATGNVEWPQADDLNPQPLPPHGIEHHYALLGFASWPNQQLNIENAQFEFSPLMSTMSESALPVSHDFPLPHPVFPPRHPVFPLPHPVQPLTPTPDAAPKKPPKARKRQVKKSPASPPS